MRIPWFLYFTSAGNPYVTYHLWAGTLKQRRTLKQRCHKDQGLATVTCQGVTCAPL